MYTIKSVCKNEGPKAAVTTYYALFETVMRYGLLAWISAANSSLEKVFKVQKLAIRSIVNVQLDVSCKSFLKD